MSLEKGGESVPKYLEERDLTLSCTFQSETTEMSAAVKALCVAQGRDWVDYTGSQSQPSIQRNRFRLPASAIMPGSDCIWACICNPLTCLGCRHLILTLNH